LRKESPFELIALARQTLKQVPQSRGQSHALLSVGPLLGTLSELKQAGASLVRSQQLTRLSNDGQRLRVRLRDLGPEHLEKVQEPIRRHT
jgi:hypothetical protein